MTAANAATANVSFIASDRQLRVLMLEREEELKESEAFDGE